MNEAPVGLARHGVFVLLPQKADVVRFLELLHVAGVVAVFSVKELDGTNVFVAAMNRLDFAVTAQITGDLWRGDTQGQQNEKDQDDHAKKHEAIFVFVDIRSIGL